MRKINILLVTCLLLTVSLRAQDEPAKEPKQYFPQAGSFGIGIDGGPIFDFIGNMFNGTANNGLNFNDNRLYFRYFLTDQSAVRAVISIGNTKDVNRHYVQDDAALAADPNSTKQLEDMHISKTRSYELRLGYQMFRDIWRLRGFFGGDIGYSYARTRDTYQYGNSMTALNPNPSTALFGNAAVRNLEVNNGPVNSIFVGLFTGAEYYIMPNVALGGEFGFAYGGSWTGQTNAKQELMVESRHIEQDVAITPKSKSFTADTMFPYTYGSLYFVIHF